MEPNETKEDLSSLELNAVAGGAPETAIKCQYCGKWSVASVVETKSSGGCWSNTSWLCQYCGNWNDKWRT